MKINSITKYFLFTISLRFMFPGCPRCAPAARDWQASLQSQECLPKRPVWAIQRPCQPHEGAGAPKYSWLNLFINKTLIRSKTFTGEIRSSGPAAPWLGIWSVTRLLMFWPSSPPSTMPWPGEQNITFDKTSQGMSNIGLRSSISMFDCIGLTSRCHYLTPLVSTHITSNIL